MVNCDSRRGGLGCPQLWTRLLVFWWVVGGCFFSGPLRWWSRTVDFIGGAGGVFWVVCGWGGWLVSSASLFIDFVLSIGLTGVCGGVCGWRGCVVR